MSVDPDLAETDQPYAYAGDDPVNEGDPTGDRGSVPPTGGSCIITIPGVPTIPESISAHFTQLPDNPSLELPPLTGPPDTSQEPDQLLAIDNSVLVPALSTFDGAQKLAGILTNGNPSNYTPDIPPVTVNEFIQGGGAWRPVALASFMWEYGGVIGAYPTVAQVIQVETNSALVKPKLSHNDAAFVATAMIDKATVLTNDQGMYNYLENLRPKWPAYNWSQM